MGLNFNRSDQAAAKEIGGWFHEERDIKWVNPREFHRQVITLVQDLGYVVPDGAEGHTFEMRKEIIGEKSGTVEARVAGRKTSKGFLEVPHRPRAEAGLAAMVAGGAAVVVGLFLFGVSVGAALTLLLLGTAMSGAGYLLWKDERTVQVPMEAHLMMRILGRGEVTERTLVRSGSSVTDLFAQIGLTIDLSQTHWVNVGGIPPNVRASFAKAFQPKLNAQDQSLLWPIPAIRSPFTGALHPETAIRFRSLFDEAPRDFENLKREIQASKRSLDADRGPVLRVDGS